MRVIIAGSRTITDYDVVTAAIASSGFEISVVLSGRARGVDSLGELWAREHGVSVLPFPAEWQRYGRRAGIRRNEQMVAQADALVAIWDRKSRRSRHVIGEARRRGLRVYVKTTSSPSF